MKLRTFEGAAKVTQALSAGQIDFAVMAGGPVVSSLNTDRPLLTTVVFNGRLNDLLVTNKKIKSGADLKGMLISRASASPSVPTDRPGTSTQSVQWRSWG